MNLKLERKILGTTFTIGELYIDGELECNTLEDKDRELELGGEKIPKETAIPKGSYKVIIDKSERFKKEMPHILDVPNFTGIRIHIGNTEADVEGCILVGEYVADDMKSVINSKKAFDKLFKKLKEAEEIEIEIC